MKFTVNWLKEYVALDRPATEIGARLTMLGLEVDSMVRLQSGIETIKVAKVLEVRPHPNADRLSLCTVEVDGEQLPVVCGAPNVRAGMLAPIATVGTTMPSGMQVKKAKLRGELSCGMLCSEKELGIGEGNDGIMDLPAEAAQAGSLVAALGLDDTVIEVDLTPNRPDCTSVIGIAREMAGAFGKKLQIPVRREELPSLDGKNTDFEVTVEAPGDCPRYAARRISKVTIGPSPLWLQNRLRAVGMRPINNVVDVTNFVMLEFGQPLHAFDFHKLAGSRIVVRHARAGETIATLDGTTRSLEPDMLLICDGQRPVAVAGVMGGENSEVTSSTTEILLESAFFNPVSVRRTARRLNLATESSYRFERGIDIGGVDLALERAVQLIVALSGGSAQPSGLDRLSGSLPRISLNLRVKRCNDLLGLLLSKEEIAQCLVAIGFEVEAAGEDVLAVGVPSFRVDIEREIDLIEEVARLTGYNEIPTTLPVVPLSFPVSAKGRTLSQRVKSLLTASGFYEAINYSFVSEQHPALLCLGKEDPRCHGMALMNPLSAEQSVMRTTLLPGLLENLRRNCNHQSGDVRLFEVGKVFAPREGHLQPAETASLAAVLSGRRYPGAAVLHFSHATVDLHDAAGVVQTLARELRLPGLALRADDANFAEAPYAETGTMCAIVLADTASTGRTIGRVGRLADKVARSFGIKQEVFFLELDLEALLTVESEPKKFSQLPKYPSVYRDISVLVPEQTEAGLLLETIRAADQLVEHAELFDIYRSDTIEAGFKSVALAVTYRSPEQTLDDEKVNAVHGRIVKLIETRYSAQLR